MLPRLSRPELVTQRAVEQAGPVQVAPTNQRIKIRTKKERKPERTKRIRMKRERRKRRKRAEKVVEVST